MNISVVGLGYVGCVSVGCLANSGHKVIGVDIDKNKVDLVGRAKASIIEKDIDSLFEKNKQNISATININEAVMDSDISIICVGTPNGANGLLNLRYIYDVAEKLGEALVYKNTYHIVSVRSTVSPGTCEEIVNIIQRISSKKVGIDFDVISNPEFLREGSAVHDYYNPEYIVIGVKDRGSKAIDIIKELYVDVKGKFLITSIESAEIIKYVNNTWHALKITFANEIGNVCKRLNINSYEVMDIFCHDKKLNLSPYYLKPGFSYGGSCLPKDLKGFVSLANSINIKTPLLDSIDKSNNNQIDLAREQIEKIGIRNITFLGISFKSGTDDVRFSPFLELAKRLFDSGYCITIHDIEVFNSIRNNVNKKIIENTIGELKKCLTDDIEKAMAVSDLIVFCNNEPYYDHLNKYLDNTNKIFYELSKYKNDINCKRFGISW